MSSIRILCQIDFPSKPARLWDGSGPYVDDGGDVWMGCTILQGLDAVEQAINGEAYTLSLGLTGITPDIANLAWADYQAGEVIGARVRIMIQGCDEGDQPVGDPDVRFTGTIDDIHFDDVVSDDRPTSTVAIDCTNRFTLRRLSNGAVLSDVDQRARSKVTNPTAPPDRFCERIPLLQDKTIVWPRWN